MQTTDRQIARLQNRIASAERQRERFLTDRKASILTARECDMLVAEANARLEEMRKELAALEEKRKELAALGA